MKFLVFDIECANNHDSVGKMCSFGYVIFDEKFNILKKEDIVMNPECEFDKYIATLGEEKKYTAVTLAYTKDYFLSQPSFEEKYEVINYILTQNYDAIFGFSVINDLKFLYDACSRYKLPSMNIISFDVAEIAKKHLNSELKGLVKLYQEVVLQDESQNDKNLIHKSVDDAVMTMQLLKHACLYNELSLQTLLDEYTFKEHRYIYCETKMRKRKTRKEVESILEKKYYDRQVVKSKSNELNALNFYLSANSKTEKIIIDIVKKIHVNGGRITNKQGEADVIITLDSNDAKKMSKYVNHRKTTFILMDRFLKAKVSFDKIYDKKANNIIRELELSKNNLFEAKSSYFAGREFSFSHTYDKMIELKSKIAAVIISNRGIVLENSIKDTIIICLDDFDRQFTTQQNEKITLKELKIYLKQSYNQTKQKIPKSLKINQSKI